MQSHQPPAVYFSLLQRSDYNQPTLDIRTATDPTAISSAVRKAIESLVLHYPLQIQSLEAGFSQTLTSERLMTMLSAFLGGLAVLLAAIGLYGLMSYAVTTRTSEIGTRMALGALPEDILRLILGEAAFLVVTGVAVGIPAAVVASRFVAGMLYGVQGADPVTMVLSVLVLAGVALLAGYWPARRASRVDPMSALRAE